MNNTKIKETQELKNVAESLGSFFAELTKVCNNFASSLEAVPTDVKEVVEVVAPVVEEVEENPVTDLAEELKTLSTKDLKTLAKDKGLKTTGKKDELIARILGEEVPVVEAEIVEEVPQEETIEETVEEAVEEVEPMDINEEATLEEKVTHQLENYTDEELKEILESVELSTKGKRQALISRVVEAVEQGMLEFDEEDDEIIEHLEEEDFIVDDEDTIDTEEEIEEDEEIEIEEELTVRQEAQEKVKEKIQTLYSKKKLTDKEISKFLDEHFNGKFQAKDKKRALTKYMEIHAELVDEDGDIHDMEDPYYVDETAYCCGSELAELDNENLYCEHCGNEYETN